MDKVKKLFCVGALSLSLLTGSAFAAWTSGDRNDDNRWDCTLMMKNKASFPVNVRVGDSIIHLPPDMVSWEESPQIDCHKLPLAYAFTYDREIDFRRSGRQHFLVIKSNAQFGRKPIEIVPDVKVWAGR